MGVLDADELGERAVQIASKQLKVEVMEQEEGDMEQQRQGDVEDDDEDDDDDADEAIEVSHCQCETLMDPEYGK